MFIILENIIIFYLKHFSSSAEYVSVVTKSLRYFDSDGKLCQKYFNVLFDLV